MPPLYWLADIAYNSNHYPKQRPRALTPFNIKRPVRRFAMKYRFVNMAENFVTQIASWHYDGEYSFYDPAADPKDLETLMNRKYWDGVTFAAMDARGVLAGWIMLYPEGQAVWLALGMKPELTGKGLGQDFLADSIEQCRNLHGHEKKTIILDVAVFNRRAIETYWRAGFNETDTVRKRTPAGEMDFLRMVMPLQPLPISEQWKS
jgi:ribosomal-protein-alanine N-acetyltransferase